MYDVAVIGCGIVGAAAAYELSRYELSVVVLERENDVAAGTTKANSAIIHAGYDPEPGTLMARLNIEGVALARELCGKLDVPYNRCGSMVLALSDDELPLLRSLYERGLQNGVPDMELLSGAQARALEPALSPDVAGALLAPSAAIVSPWEYALALIETAVVNGAELRLECTVTGIGRTTDGYALTTPGGDVHARAVLNCAGLNADLIHDMIATPAFRILPDRGEYYLLDKSEGAVVSRVIFQCPSPAGKGVLVAPTVHGNLIVGPNNERPCDRDDTATTASGLDEVARKAMRSVPGLKLGASIRNFAGIRSACDIDDFVITEAAPRFVDLAGIKSPGLTAAPAIARMAADMLRGTGLNMTPKQSFIDRRRRLRVNELDAARVAERVKKNPAYGRVVCRCETVTEGEILDALRAPVPPRSVDGVKRRVNAGMGRCQGGFCGPRIVEILARELGCSPVDVVQDAAGSYILTGETTEDARDV